MLEKCKTCAHKKVCGLKNHVIDDCYDYNHESTTYHTHFAIYDTVFIIDRFDIDNDSSQYGDGTGSKNIELVVRECFITSITIHDKAGNHLYRVQPRNLTQTEQDGFKHCYWDQSWYAKSIFANKESAINYLKECGFNNPIVK